MSTFRIQAVPGRVMVIHDMPDAAIVSELDVEQADVLLQQLEIAVRAVLRQNVGSRDASRLAVTTR